MTVAADYLGRKIDVLAFPGARPSGEVRLRQSLTEDGGYICAGVQKLAQRWLIRFATVKGSMPHAPEEGSNFFLLAAQGRLRTDTDVLLEFSLSAADVRRQMLNEEYAGMPDDERFGDAVLTSVELAPGRVSLFITISSRAGSAHEVLLPINTVI